jgi:hypothetical protein
MNKHLIEDWARTLNGREYMEETTTEEERQMYEAGIACVFGYSDDLVIFKGAIDEEIDAYGGNTVLFSKGAVLKNDCGSGDECPHFQKQIESSRAAKMYLDAEWCAREGAPPWTFEVPFEFETFDIFEEGELYCVGVVFHLSEIGGQ